MSVIYIASEDQVSVAVAEKLVDTFTGFHIKEVVWPINGSGGNGQLRARLKSYFQIANQYPFLLITDLDRTQCPITLLEDWKRTVNISQPADMVFRIAVRQIESWLLADDQAASEFMGISNVPGNPDELPNAKDALIQLAMKAPREIRDDIIIKRGAVASQGLGYNTRLTQYVRDMWCPKRASRNSESLRRCCRRLQNLCK